MVALHAGGHSKIVRHAIHRRYMPMISMRITSFLALGLLFAGAAAGLSSVFAWVHGA